MINSISSFAHNPYTSTFLAIEKKTPPVPTISKKKDDPWAGKPICKNESDPNPNCCCDGYSIEAVLEQSYENHLGDDSSVKKLQSYPCITCAELESIADELAMRAWSTEDKDKAATEEKKARERDFNAIDGFIRDEKADKAG